MDDQKQKVIDSLKQANNILITVRSNPSIDQLAACIALTLIVNELGKHGTAVFSGQIPSVLEFLEPSKTLETNTDSLRDFIISLDKSKADKLRYKVEDTVVKVFITPYRTSLSPNDLQFGQGDFNIDVVVALGVHNQNDLDQAITVHGRILHDATVISLNTDNGAGEDMGSINWLDTTVSSLSEMIFSFADQLGKDGLVDNQVATALLTGIVAETGRFSNAKTKPQTLEVAAKLLSAGANQELVAAKLTEPERSQELPQSLDQIPPVNGDDGLPIPATPPAENGKGGELDIEHSADEETSGRAAFSLPAPTPDEPSMQEGVPFAAEPSQGVEQPNVESASSQDDTPTVELPIASEDTSPIIDLNQMGAGPQVAAENQPEDHAEDQEALDYLKERKVDDTVHSRLEPIHTSSDLLEAPKIIKDEKRAEAEVPGTGPDDTVNSRFAYTAPTMGGTLTANLPDDDDSSADALADKQPTSPLLSHSTTTDSILDKSQDEEETVLNVSAPEVIQPTLDATPLHSQPSVSLPEPEADEAAKPFTTLADLEKQVHSQEEEIAVPQTMPKGPALQAIPHNDPPEGAKDMPAPVSGIKLPSPQAVSATGSVSASPLAPPPPVPPPFPNV